MVWGFTGEAFRRTKQVRPGRAPSPEGPRTEAGTPTRDRPAKGPVETGLTWSDDLHRCTLGSPAYVPAAASRCGAPPARCLTRLDSRRSSVKGVPTRSRTA